MYIIILYIHVHICYNLWLLEGEHIPYWLFRFVAWITNASSVSLSCVQRLVEPGCCQRQTAAALEPGERRGEWTDGVGI